MQNQDKEIVEQHLKTHSIRSVEDRSAVAVLETFLRSDGRINTDFSCNDKWPNTDGTFEFVLNPNQTRRPTQNFFVQIKGTQNYTEENGIIKYSLKSLAFPAYIFLNVTLDPGIIFVVLNSERRNEERVFWKYMSVSFINSINFEQQSITMQFTPDEEIKNTDESINAFCEKLDAIIRRHLFVNKLEDRYYSKDDIYKIIKHCDQYITEDIDRIKLTNDSRDSVSNRILAKLDDLCRATLLLNALDGDCSKANLQLAWERSLLSIKTKYLGSFLRGLSYIGGRYPESGQAERLMLKYYNFLWQIRQFLRETYEISILNNLEDFPHELDTLDKEYYTLVAKAVDSIDHKPLGWCNSRFYIQKKRPFFIGQERYYELTLQLAGVYATKFNRITAYTKINISTNYSVQISYIDKEIDLWGIGSKIKVITDWRVSIDPTCLNKLSKILLFSTTISSRYGEYEALMNFLTNTGINLLDLIDLQKVQFYPIIDNIYKNTNTCKFKDVLIKLKEHYSKNSEESVESGRNVVRYLLLGLQEETIESVLPTKYNTKCLNKDLLISSRCYPFDKNPFISNLAGRKTSDGHQLKYLASVASRKKMNLVLPYLTLQNAIRQTGEIYFDVESIASTEKIDQYNASLDSWERNQGYQIKVSNNMAYIDSYEQTTIEILQKLIDLSECNNTGQKEYNKHFIDSEKVHFTDPLKREAIANIFTKSRLILIYGAAGTGKTTLINYISKLMPNHRKLFLTKTHTALQNMKRRIDTPGTSSEFVSMDSFTKKVELPDYDIIFVDECSTIDNRTMQKFLRKLGPKTFLVLAGDIHQIESIDFGNWFFYAKDIIKTPGANVELLNTWRTNEETLKQLWSEVRQRGTLITEMLVIDGPFSENIGPNVFEHTQDDEVVLCLNYDGKFGLNNMNNYFQNANNNGSVITWQEWTYRVGDPILFNDTKRFPLLYNNLKGRIVAIEKTESEISFTVDVGILLTQIDCEREGLDFIKLNNSESSTRIRFSVYAYDSKDIEEDDELRIRSIVPFQLAYAVSIHKAQGLEYDSVKIIIPSSNAEKITHGIFYTAITRAKKELKIYWSAETMEKVIESFSIDDSQQNSRDIIKSKLFLE